MASFPFTGGDSDDDSGDGGTVTFGDGSGSSSPTGSFFPSGGGGGGGISGQGGTGAGDRDLDTGGGAPPGGTGFSRGGGGGATGPVPNVEDTQDVTVKTVSETKSGAVTATLRAVGNDRPVSVKVPVRRDGQLVASKTVTLSPLEKRTVTFSDVDASGDVDVGGVNIRFSEPGLSGGGGGSDSQVDVSVSTQVAGKIGAALASGKISASKARKLAQGKGDMSILDGFSRGESDGDFSGTGGSGPFGGDDKGPLEDANPDAESPSGTVTFGDGKGPASPDLMSGTSFNPIPGGVSIPSNRGTGGFSGRALALLVGAVGLVAVVLGGD